MPAPDDVPAVWLSELTEYSMHDGPYAARGFEAPDGSVFTGMLFMLSVEGTARYAVMPGVPDVAAVVIGDDGGAGRGQVVTFTDPGEAARFYSESFGVVPPITLSAEVVFEHARRTMRSN